MQILRFLVVHLDGALPRHPRSSPLRTFFVGGAVQQHKCAAPGRVEGGGSSGPDDASEPGQVWKTGRLEDAGLTAQRAGCPGRVLEGRDGPSAGGWAEGTRPSSLEGSTCAAVPRVHPLGQPRTRRVVRSL